MTRQEITGWRNKDFSQWIRKNLPDSMTGFYVQDIDFILIDFRRKRVMLLEEKTHSRAISPAQENVMALIDRWLKNGVDNGWKYIGYYSIVFENTSPENGRIWFDGVEVDEDTLIQILSMGRFPYR